MEDFNQSVTKNFALQKHEADNYQRTTEEGKMRNQWAITILIKVQVWMGGGEGRDQGLTSELRMEQKGGIKQKSIQKAKWTGFGQLWGKLEDELKGEVRSEFQVWGLDNKQVGHSQICRISEKEQVKDGEEMMNSFWLGFGSQVKSREQLNFISGVQMIWI